jgi:hypothetical protein
MIGAELISFESYSDLYGSQLPFNEFCKQISMFSRDSILWICSYVGVSLQLWEGDGLESQNLEFLFTHFFEPKLATILLMRHRFYADGRRVVFHRRQLLFLSKLALKHCSEQGLNASVQTRAFGLLFLHANDHFHFDLIHEVINGAYSREDFARVLTETLAAEEYSHAQIPNFFVRSRKMCLALPKALTEHPDYVDIESMFLDTYKIELKLYQYLTFGVSSRFGIRLASALRNDPSLLPIRTRDFVTSEIDPDIVIRFLDLMSSSAAQMSTHPSVYREDLGTRSRWASDCTVFRKTPMVMQWYGVTSPNIYSGHLLMDHYFLFQKVVTEPYFMGMGSVADGFGRFWGALFERYVNDIFSQTTNSSVAQHIANPRLVGAPNEELCDGVILAGDTIVLMEYKSSMIRADQKYGGDYKALLREISEKFVYDSKDKHPKAVMQLSAAVKKLFGVGSLAKADWCDFSKIKCCYVLTITLDTIGGALGISPLLDTFFQQQLADQPLRDIRLRPFFCTDIETLEMLSGNFATKSLPSLLERWYQINNLLATPLAAIRMEDLLPARPKWLWEEWASFSEEATRALFGEASDAMAILRQQQQKIWQ